MSVHSCLQPNPDRRKQAIEDLVTTEEDYVNKLGILLTYYADCLNNFRIIKEKEYNILFPNILRSIHNLHTQLLKDFDNRINIDTFDNNTAVISDIFLRFETAPFADKGFS